jgi:hypothetical protein
VPGDDGGERAFAGVGEDAGLPHAGHADRTHLDPGVDRCDYFSTTM